MKFSSKTIVVIGFLLLFTVHCYASPPKHQYKFEYKGWTTDEELYLKQFIGRLIPLLTDIMGPQASSQTIRFEKSGGRSEWKNNVAILATDELSYIYLNHIAHEITHIFQWPYNPLVPALKEGVAVTVSHYALLNYKNRYGDPMVIPHMNAYLDDFQIYDFLNQADAAGQVVGIMWPYRDMHQYYGLGAGVVHKLLIRDPSYLKKFNAELYRRGEQNKDIIKDLAAIQTIARNAAGGQVEGHNFDDWYSRQYCLNKNIKPGLKLYCSFEWDYPNGSGIRIHRLTHWKTETSEPGSGSPYKETPLTDTAKVSVFAFNESLLKEGTVKIKDGYNVIDKKYDPKEPLNPLDFYAFWADFPHLDPQRLEIDITIGGKTWTYYFPHKVKNGGVLVGADTGTVEVQDLRTAKRQIAKIVKGVFHLKEDNPNPTILFYKADIPHSSLASPEYRFVGRYVRTKYTVPGIVLLNASEAKWEPIQYEPLLPRTIEGLKIDEPLLRTDKIEIPRPIE